MKRRARSRGWARTSAPRDSFEELEIRTSDGASLRAVIGDPPPDVPFVGTAVLAHAMFARKSQWGHPARPGAAHAFAALGFRTIAFDFRGHGQSTVPPRNATWTYDELVRFDVPEVVAAARARAEDKPVFVVGHSLGGHVSLAAQGTGRLRADGIVAIGASVWHRSFEPARLLWGAKNVAARLLLETSRRVGRFPARALRFGSDDASTEALTTTFRPLLEGVWRSDDGVDDYGAGLSRVAVPVCAVSSEGDHFICPPASAEAFARRTSGPVACLRVARGSDGRPAPSHMAIVTSTAARPTLEAALGWVARVASKAMV